MTETAEATGLRDVLRLLRTLETLHHDLCGLISSKTDAMRTNDLDAMQELGAREMELATRIREREGLLRQLVDAIGARAGWPKKAVRALTLSQLASRVPEPHRSALLAARAGLRDAVARVAKANRVSSQIARGIVDHLRWVFESVRPRQADPVVYSDAGALPARSETMIVDTLG